MCTDQSSASVEIKSGQFNWAIWVPGEEGALTVKRPLRRQLSCLTSCLLRPETTSVPQPWASMAAPPIIIIFDLYKAAYKAYCSGESVGKLHPKNRWARIENGKWTTPIGLELNVD